MTIHTILNKYQLEWLLTYLFLGVLWRLDQVVVMVVHLLGGGLGVSLLRLLIFDGLLCLILNLLSGC